MFGVGGTFTSSNNLDLALQIQVIGGGKICLWSSFSASELPPEGPATPRHSRVTSGHPQNVFFLKNNKKIKTSNNKHNDKKTTKMEEEEKEEATAAAFDGGESKHAQKQNYIYKLPIDRLSGCYW